MKNNIKDNQSQNECLIISELKDVVQDCNVNFLVGAGLSAPYLSLLGSVEKLLTDLSKRKEDNKIDENQEKLIKASIYKHFFDEVVGKNVEILPDLKNCDAKSVLKNYQDFTKTVNTVLLNRRSTILSRQVNIFTTNFDVFFEKAMEEVYVEYNDGFNGHFNPVFNIGNLKKSIFKRSLHYDNTYELPVFNLIKLHGSLTWKKDSDKETIYLDRDLKQIQNIKQKLPTNKSLIDITNLEKKFKEKLNIEHLINSISEGSSLEECINTFIKEYEKLAIINPTKEKFKQTVLQRNYYDLLRLYSTELEKENTVLFVMGFSFSDEHIRQVTVQVANSNPTLKIYIFCHTEKSKECIKSKIVDTLNNENVKFIGPENICKEQKEMCFQLLNKQVFKKLLGKIDGKKQ